MGSAVLSPKGVERAKSGHVWIYRSDVADVSEARGGDIVNVVGPRGRPLGAAFYSDRSQIALRLLTHGGQSASAALVRDRIAAAVRYRETLGIDATAYRLVHGEGDLVPSLVVDRYGDHLVVQCLSQGTDRLFPQIVELLNELLTPAGIVARHDSKVRGLEGLESVVSVVAGQVPSHVPVREGSVWFDVDLHGGQKTGLFLDQRENREAAGRYAHGRLSIASATTAGSRWRCQGVAAS